MSTAIANLQTLRQQLAEKLQSAQAMLPPATSSRITVKQNKEFVFPDGRKTDQPWEAVVLCHTWFNAYYTKRYVAGEVESPACWAANLDANSLAPNDTVKKPECKACAECPKNQWDSSPTGRGKACSNKVRLAVVPPDADNTTPVWYIDLSPTAQGEFAKQLRTMVSNGILLETLRVRIGFDPKSDYPKVLLQPIGDIHDEMVPHLTDLIERAKVVARVDLNYDE